jgi:hypothetical protein
VSYELGVMSWDDFTSRKKEFKLDKICYWFSLQGVLAQSKEIQALKDNLSVSHIKLF